MAFPWGGSLTHAQLAQKFGWLSVIISVLLFPVTWFIRTCLCYPFFLACLSKRVKKTVRYEYPNDPDLVRTQFYENPNKLQEFGFCQNFNVLADVKGCRWFESCWGLIHAIDLRVTGNTWTLTPSHRCFFGAGSRVDLFFAEDGKSHTVSFDLEVQMQPIAVLWISFLFCSVKCFGYRSMRPWLAQKGARIVPPKSKDSRCSVRSNGAKIVRFRSRTG